MEAKRFHLRSGLEVEFGESRRKAPKTTKDGLMPIQGFHLRLSVVADAERQADDDERCEMISLAWQQAVEFASATEGCDRENVQVVMNGRLQQNRYDAPAHVHIIVPAVGEKLLPVVFRPEAHGLPIAS